MGNLREVENIDGKVCDKVEKCNGKKVAKFKNLKNFMEKLEKKFNGKI